LIPLFSSSILRFKDFDLATPQDASTSSTPFFFFFFFFYTNNGIFFIYFLRTYFHIIHEMVENPEVPP